jgi:hypothetical protein
MLPPAIVIQTFGQVFAGLVQKHLSIEELLDPLVTIVDEELLEAI